MSTIRVDTRFNAERIEQELVFDNDPVGAIRLQIIRLQDEGVRKALIELGWTPPDTKRCPHCGTHEVELTRTCHNSSCSAYASEESVYKGWERPIR